MAIEPPLNCCASPAVALGQPAAAAAALSSQLLPLLLPSLPPLLLLLLASLPSAAPAMPLSPAGSAAPLPAADAAALLPAAGIAAPPPIAGAAAPLLALLPRAALLLVLCGLGATAAAPVVSASRPARLNLRPLIQQRVASSTLANTISLQRLGMGAELQSAGRGGTGEAQEFGEPASCH